MKQIRKVLSMIRGMVGHAFVNFADANWSQPKSILIPKELGLKCQKKKGQNLGGNKMRLDEIIERYHFDEKSGDFFVRQLFSMKNKNQMILDVHWMIKTLKEIREVIKVV